MNLLNAFIAALIFGFGLILSGMSNPGKVLGFLDLAGKWDPSLALVMIGAIGIASPAFAYARKHGQTLRAAPLSLPNTRKIDRRLVVGSLLFGSGWGIAGICPGPALVLIGSMNVKGIVFALAMLMGMLGFESLERRKNTQTIL